MLAAGVTNLGLASEIYSGGVLTGFNLVGETLAIPVSESEQGGVDLNGDGDAADRVLHIHDIATSSTTNLEVAVSGAVNQWTRPIKLREGLFAFIVNEQDQGGVDLNNDGDFNDAVVHVYDATSAVLTNLGLAGYVPAAAESRVIVNVREADQGNTDLNGDGDTDDTVTHVYDALTGTITNLGIAAGDGVVDSEHNLLALSVNESLQGGRDLNGDGDALDGVVHVYDLERSMGEWSRCAYGSGVRGIRI
jgi:hypothetical protein